MNEEYVQEEPVTEVTENTDAQSAEEVEEGIEITDTSEGVEEDKETIETDEKKEVKTYTEEELEKIVNEKVNSILPNKIERERRKIDREYRDKLSKYEETESILSAGLEKSGIDNINSELRTFYKNQGVDIPVQTKPNYSDEDEKALGELEANKIIKLGFEEMQDEANRLADIGSDKMTVREKAMFNTLAKELTSQKNKKELAKIGVKGEILEDLNFRQFSSQFNSNVPIQKVYEMYAKINNEKPDYENPGSMKGVKKPGIKEYYSPEEIERLTDEELDNPKVWDAVRRSMTGQS